MGEQDKKSDLLRLCGFSGLEYVKSRVFVNQNYHFEAEIDYHALGVTDIDHMSFRRGSYSLRDPKDKCSRFTSRQSNINTSVVVAYYLISAWGARLGSEILG